MGNTEEGSNGMSYDFGVAIARGTVQSLAATVTGVIALTGAIIGIVNASEAMDNRLNKNQITLGGYANTMKAVQFAQDKVMSGVGFSTDDMLAGFKELNHAGLDARKNFDLVAKAASGSGKDFASISATIRNGDYGALAEMGVITDRMATRMGQMGYTQKRNSQEVLKLLEKADKMKMFDGAVQTLEQIKNRLSSFAGLFTQSMLGDPKDPEGLAVTVKKHLTMVADYFEKHKNTIIYYGKMVGLVLRTAFRVVGDFVKMIAKNVFHLDQVTQKSNQTMQDNMMSFGLWLEIQRTRIKVFFEDYGKYIGAAIKLFLAYKVAQTALSFGKSIHTSMVKFFLKMSEKMAGAKKDWKMFKYVGGTAFDTMKSGASSLGSGFARLIPMAWSFAAPILAVLAPFAAIIAAIALIAAGVYLLIKYWDDIWYATQDISDAWGLLLGPLFFMIKYWEEIKATISNVFNSVKLWGLEAYLKILGYWNDFKQFFVDMWTNITGFVSSLWEGVVATFHEWFDPMLNYLAEFFRPLIDSATAVWTFLNDNLFIPIQDFFTSIGTWIDENIVKPISDVAKNISGFFGDLFGSGVDKSNNMLQNQASSTNNQIEKSLQRGDITKSEADALRKMTNDTASKGMTNADVQNVKAEKKVSVENARAKRAAENGDAGAGIVSGKSSANIDFGGKNPDFGSLSGSSNTTNINKGAVVINIGANSGLDENKLAALVEKKLKDLGYKNKMREGN